MHILYISEAFSKPGEAGATRPWVQAISMAQRGHRVTVITSKRNYYTDEVRPEAAGKLINFCREEGMDIWQVYTTPGPQRSMLRRVMFYLTYAVMTILVGLRSPKADLIYARTPALLAPVSGWLLSKWHRARFVIAIGDLHPEESVALGLIKSSLLIRAWEAMENFFRRRADLLVVLVPGIKQLLMAKGFAGDVIQVSTNGYDPLEKQDEPLPPTTAAALERAGASFVVMYAGTIGFGQPLEIVVEAARNLQQECPEIRFVLVGKGQKLVSLRELAQKEKVKNIQFLEPIPRNCMTSLYSKAHALMHLVYAGDATCDYNLPNKFFEYLGSGKPVVYSGTGDIAEHLRKARCGMVVPPQDSRAFAEAIKYLQAYPDEAKEMGRRGQEYVKKHFNRQEILSILMRRLEALVYSPQMTRDT